MQKIATKLVRRFIYLPYQARLKESEIQSLNERMEGGDLVQMFKIVKGLDTVYLRKSLNFKSP